jgi:RHS repeat-associated protein
LRYTYKSIYDEGSQNYIDAQYINKEIIRKLSNYSTLFNFSYEYDEMGFISKIKNNLDGTYIVYDYDKKGQLSEEKYYDSASVWHSTKYFYDVNGNITDRQYFISSISGGNAPASYESLCYGNSNWKDQISSITSNGYNCSSATYTYDQIGNLKFDYNKGLQYDFNGKQLHTVKNLSNNGNITFAYNGSGIRIGKVLSYFTSNRLSYTDYDLDGNKIMHEFIHNDPLYGSDTHLYYNYDEYGKILSVTLRNDLELIFETYFYITNMLGDVIGIVDSNGTLIEEYKYDAWGNLLNENEIYSDIGILNPFRYRGYYYDSDLGLYYLNSRYYDATIGRFISADDTSYLNPSSINGLNLYAYCGNNPIMMVDPLGHDFWSVLGDVGRFVGGLVITATGVIAMGALVYFAGESVLYTGFGTLFTASLSLTMYGGFIIGSSWDKQIKADMDNIHWNPFNDDASLAASCTKVSFYKGQSIIVQDFATSSFSAGIMFLHSTQKNADTIYHEWGHFGQLLIMGPAAYTVLVGIPSVYYNLTGAYLSATYPNDERMYYSKIWERSADWLGGINRGNYDSFWNWSNFVPW